jgi:hypothetical protein
MHMRWLESHGHLNAVVHMLVPRTARLLGSADAEAFSIKPEMIVGKRVIRSH